MKRCNTRSITRSRLLELPLHLIYDILSRLTVDIVFKCKCVCKTLLEILRDPSFVELYLTKAPKCLIMQEGGLMSYFILIYKYRFDLEKPDSNYDDSHPCQSVAIPSIPSRFNQFSTPLLAATSNGLLLICFINWGKFTCIYYICNPVLGEFVPLPPYMETKFRIDEYVDFGFCPKTKQYKVIWLCCQVSKVYTLGTGSWRDMGTAPLPHSLYCIGRCSLNGNLHWIVENFTVSNFICSFSLETEKFSFISSPAQLNPDALSNINMAMLGLLDGLLCFNYFLGYRFEAFVMKDYGRDGFWMKELSIDLSTNYMSQDSMHYAFEFLENGELFLKRDSIIVSCNLRNGITRQILGNKFRRFRVKSFVPSLISLKDIMEDEVARGYMEVVERKMGRNLLSENGFQFSDKCLHL